VGECARRNADGEIVLRGPEGAEATAVRTVVVEGELLFALASGRTAPALRYDARQVGGWVDRAGDGILSWAPGGVSGARPGRLR
jgi:hypothetical protein